MGAHRRPHGLEQHEPEPTVGHGYTGEEQRSHQVAPEVRAARASPPATLRRDVGGEDEAGTHKRGHLQEELDTSPSDRQTWLGLTVGLAARAAVNPRLALDLIRTVWSFRRRRWYRRPPFLPIPSREYLRWRMYTAYGDEQAVPPSEDVIRFARWRREVMHL